jgi:hypothetical protein
MLKIQTKYKLLLPLISTTLLISCSTYSKHSSSSLANQGILPLSTTNPYLGTNLFLAQQAENSAILYNFLKKRGGPTAMELIDESFGKPRMLLYYPRNKEVYAVDLEKRNNVIEWFPRGPFGIERNDFKSLVGTTTSMLGEPVFILRGKESRFRFSKAPSETKVITPHVPVITPNPTPAPIIKKIGNKKTTTETSPGTEAPSINNFKPLNTDQQALMMAKGYAERADNGDVIHTVKGTKETISNIVKWYTGGIKDLEKIKQMNSVTSDEPISQGTRVRIPLASLKNLKAMP